MKARIITLTLPLIFSVPSVFGQSLEKADKKELKKVEKNILFEDYIAAFEMVDPLYEKYPSNVDVKFNYAICKLYQKGNEEEAYEILKSIKDSRGLENFYFYMGKAYHWRGDFDDAISSFQTVLTDSKRTMHEDDVVEWLNKSYYSLELMKDQRNVDVVNLGEQVNSEFQESSPVLMPGEKGMFFTSRNQNNSSSSKDYKEEFFQEVFYAKNNEGRWEGTQNMKDINSELHDASVSINANGSLFIFFKTNPDNISGGDLYQANLDAEGKMTNVKKLSENINSKYVEASACLTPDENTLYFSSNRPGGYGGFDLYKCNKLPNGEWALPQNLGPIINTKGSETAPYIHADGRTMYFASSGHSGLGGYDIFETRLDKKKYWKKPENMGYPINTKNHDMYFSISADSRSAYMSSDREGGYGSDDIYQVKMLDHESFKTVVKGNVLNSDGEALKTKITLINKQNRNLNGIYRTNPNNGSFIVVVQPKQVYQFIIESPGYETQFIDYSFEELKELEQIKVSLNRNS